MTCAFSLTDKLPSHWQLKRLKHIARVQTGMAKGKDHGEADTVEVPYLRVANVQDGYLALDDVATMTVPVAELERYRLQPGDVLMNEGGDFDKLGRGHVWQGQIDPCIHQNHVFAVRPHGVSPAWLNAWTGSAPAQFYFMGRAKQSTNLASISSSNVMELPVPVPPPAEQAALLALITRETTRIDALIAKKTRFIALLREKRQALITEAVTRGLDPSAPMKDSGVEWLGRVPAHWTVTALKNVWSVVDCKHLTAEFVDDGIPLASIREVQSQFVDLTNAKQTTEKFYLQLIDGGRKPLAGDLIFSRNATVGEVTQVPENAPAFALGQDVCLLRKCRANQSSDYMQAVLKSRVTADQLELIMVGATFQRVNVEEIRNLSIVVPPDTEQHEIALYKKGRMRQIDQLVATSARSIDLLKEHRSALITAAVTGQLDLREPA